MSAPFNSSRPSEVFGPAEIALIAICKLPPETVEQICTQMNVKRQSFADAAIFLGLVTPEEVEKARLAVMESVQTGKKSLVETAFRKFSSSRGVVPIETADTVQPSKQLLIAYAPYDPRSERIRALRTELMLRIHENSRANVIAVLSAMPRQGKTQLAAELAVAFAQLGRKTLLVDADLRKSQIHNYFGCSNEQGLSGVLAAGERPYMHRVEGLAQMCLLTAGPPPPNPLELLSSHRLSNLITDWRRAFDFVVIDTPCVSDCADGIAVAAEAGRVLLVNRATQTTFRETKAMLRRLASTHAEIVGAVLNHF
jgi:protein-tyrosine kinase